MTLFVVKLRDNTGWYSISHLQHWEYVYLVVVTIVIIVVGIMWTQNLLTVADHLIHQSETLSL